MPETTSDGADGTATSGVEEAAAAGAVTAAAATGATAAPMADGTAAGSVFTAAATMDRHLESCLENIACDTNNDKCFVARAWFFTLYSVVVGHSF